MKIVFSTLVVIAGLLSAQAHAVKPYYTYIGGGYAHEGRDEDEGFGIDCDQDGWYVNGSMPLNNVFFIQAERAKVDGGGCRSTTTAFSAGIRGSVTSNSDLYATAGVVTHKLGGAKERGLEMSAGVRAMVQQDVELRGYFGFRNIDDDLFEYVDGSFFGAGFSYWFSHGELALTGDFTYTEEEAQGMKVGIRLNIY